MVITGSRAFGPFSGFSLFFHQNLILIDQAPSFGDVFRKHLLQLPSPQPPELTITH
jgi:hypothetical protein